LYLGRYDIWAKLLPLPTLLGSYGVWRARHFGVDDQVSWLLMPLLGLTLAACALNAIVYGLKSPEKWNQEFNPASPEAAQGNTDWLTVAGLVAALGLGTTVLMATLAFGIQRSFEYQMQTAQSDATLGTVKKSAD
jgi:hypothetical protein